MKSHIQYIKLLFLFGVASVGMTACYDVENDRAICDYKVRLRYDYNEENSTTANMIEYYVYTIDEYIFDEAGILYQHRSFTPDKCRQYMDSEINLPPGRYSVIAVGNQDERSAATDTRNGYESVAGVTRREDMLLALDNAEQVTRGGEAAYGPSERLYYGYKTFTVKEQGISRIRVDMINAHFTLRFRVTWKNGATPARGSGYYALLESVPSEYALMPEYIYPAGSFECLPFDSNIYDTYPSDCNSVIHHIPNTCHQRKNMLTHRNNTKINADNELWGEFTTYRIKIADSPKLRIARSADDEMIIPKAIDLKEYFEWYDLEPDYALRQDYNIDIVIDGDKITLMPLNIADWDEGGVLGN